MLARSWPLTRPLRLHFPGKGIAQPRAIDLHDRRGNAVGLDQIERIDPTKLKAYREVIAARFFDIPATAVLEVAERLRRDSGE